MKLLSESHQGPESKWMFSAKIYILAVVFEDETPRKEAQELLPFNVYILMFFFLCNLYKWTLKIFCKIWLSYIPFYSTAPIKPKPFNKNDDTKCTRMEINYECKPNMLIEKIMVQNETKKTHLIWCLYI